MKKLFVLTTCAIAIAAISCSSPKKEGVVEDSVTLKEEILDIEFETEILDEQVEDLNKVEATLDEALNDLDF